MKQTIFIACILWASVIISSQAFSDSVCYEDKDQDGYGNLEVTGECGPGFIDNSNDCDDNDADIYPGCSTAVCRICYQDADSDGDGNPEVSKGCIDTCTAGYVENIDDCNDNNSEIFKDAPEKCNTKDDDCDGAIDENMKQRFYIDVDGDGCGVAESFITVCPTESGSPPSGYASEACDCDDSNEFRFSGNIEQTCNGIDEDCNDIDPCPGSGDCINIPDVPLETIAEQPPPMVMFVIDNSGSMDHEIMTAENMGNFDNDTWWDFLRLFGNYSYVYAANGDKGLKSDHLYGESEALEGHTITIEILGFTIESKFLSVIEDYLVKAHWNLLTQWHEYNKLFYNPKTTYDPWPNMDNANIDKPRSNPLSADIQTDLRKEFFKTSSFEVCETCIEKKWYGEITKKCKCVPHDAVSVKRSHYYVQSKIDNQIYLVNIETDKIQYYRVDYYEDYTFKIWGIDTGLQTKPDYTVRKLYKTNNPPSDVLTNRTVQQERQNFSNWYSYYRRRMFAVKAAIAKAITNIEGAKIGFYFINNKHNSNRASDIKNQELLPVKCRNTDDISNITLEDRTSELLDVLYHSPLKKLGTPLRLALKETGKYFEGDSNCVASSSPFTEDGGECQHAFSILLTDGFWSGGSPDVGNVDFHEGSCFKDDYDNTLADVAMRYYKDDLRSGLDNFVPPRPGDNAVHQHMVTYSLSFGVGGSINPDNYPNCPPEIIPESGCPCPEWPEIQKNTNSTIDDLYHAAVNGRGRFFKATDSKELADSIQVIINQIPTSGSVASISSSGPKLETNINIYQGSYNSKDWSGDLKAFSLKSGSTNEFDFENHKWSASAQLKEKEWRSRQIFTSNNGTNLIPFDTGMASTLKDRIYADATIQDRIINYIKGDDTYEKRNNVGHYRNRYSKLGDIIHSSPLYVDNETGPDFVYIGANDGMVHLLDAATGEELYGYIPNLVFENLKNLVNQNYFHTYYVDATPVFKSTNIGNFVIGGLGKGGKGYYCLNFNDFTRSWEFPSNSNPDDSVVTMGYSYSTPYIVESQVGFVVIFGNGYNSSKETAALYIRNVTDGSKVATISTKSGGCNGLSTPALIDIDFDGIVDYAYAGDLRGQLWKFDLRDSNPNNWKVAYGTTSAPKPLFQAKNIKGTPQPITSKPDVFSHCLINREGYIVVFGTGSYITDGDTKSIDQQTLYAIWDWQNDERDASFYFGAFDEDRKLSHMIEFGSGYEKLTLQKQNLEIDYTQGNYLVLSDNSLTWYPDKNEDEVSHVGWYFDLPKSGERIVANPSVREGKIFMATLVPAKKKCGVDGKSSIYILDACSGGRLADPVFKVNDEYVKVEAPGLEAVPPSGIELQTVVNNPVFLHDPNNQSDVLIFGDLGDSVVLPSIEIKSEQGRFYWKY
jgi:type IV pilus assembly protein PilY1